ncbi:STAS domain-containing protein [Parahaliea aestuarii]|uniref:Anti-sigma factor antagonist n=1 Tax=Parahaliea aestuarii TaxID=1852021 RepID=A0A5C9A2X7_9GAMM|nr:STAS domain-containing protein [Parahaliea aestuarii]TXS94429.1 STAS domain-containing protein [Parahaliea aestuarii]
MFEVHPDSNGLRLAGRLDAAAAPLAEPHFEALSGAAEVDLANLEYISSAGLGVLLKAHKRLSAGGAGLRLVQVSPHIVEILHFSGFDMLFEVVPASDPA